MDPLSGMPRALIDDVRAFEASGAAPVEPRDASSVILLRDGASGPEVYLLKRHGAMAFAGGFCVFPGGGVDPRDFDTTVAWAGPSTAQWARDMRCGEETARALVCAAVRETFEESGVLLAGPSADSVVEDTTGEDWEADRRALEARELSMTDFLDRRGLVLRSDLLRFWAHWITPLREPRRFDTRFFVAALPAGQVTRDVSSESEKVTWLPAGEAARAVEAQRLAMLPPTYVNCDDVSAHATTAALMAAAATRTPTVVRPRLVVDEAGAGRLVVARS